MRLKRSCLLNTEMDAHLGSKRTALFPRPGHFQRSVARVDGLGIKPITVIAAVS